MGLKTPVQIGDLVNDFVKTQPPASRKKLKQALHELADGKGDICALRENLSGYCRLRVGDYRILFQYVNSKTGPRCFCIFAETRDVVYEKFAAILSEEGRL